MLYDFVSPLRSVLPTPYKLTHSDYLEVFRGFVLLNNGDIMPAGSRDFYWDMSGKYLKYCDAPWNGVALYECEGRACHLSWIFLTIPYCLYNKETYNSDSKKQCCFIIPYSVRTVGQGGKF
jgi:hypothetical protein